MTIDLDEGDARDDLAHPHLLTPTKRLHTIAEILANGIRRQREDARRMGESGDISAQSEREADVLEPSEPVRLDGPPPPQGWFTPCEPESPHARCPQRDDPGPRPIDRARAEALNAPSCGERSTLMSSTLSSTQNTTRAALATPMAFAQSSMCGKSFGGRSVEAAQRMQGPSLKTLRKASMSVGSNTLPSLLKSMSSQPLSPWNSKAPISMGLRALALV